MKILILGGTDKELTVAHLLSRRGYDISIAGFNTHETAGTKDVSTKNLDKYDIIILPLPCTLDGITVNAPYSNTKIPIEDIKNSFSGEAVLCGNYQCDNDNWIDYYKSDELAILNAIPTAEGAIGAAISNSGTTLFNSNCLVIGYGRIGKILSDRLSALKARITVSARKKSDFAYIKSFGYGCISTSDLQNNIFKYDYIFNTVPHLVINSAVLTDCRENTLIIDLASKPGGVDFDAAHKKGITAIHALSLPSKVAPLTSAAFIADAITGLIESL